VHYVSIVAVDNGRKDLSHYLCSLVLRELPLLLDLVEKLSTLHVPSSYFQIFILCNDIEVRIFLVVVDELHDVGMFLSRLLVEGRLTSILSISYSLTLSSPLFVLDSAEMKTFFTAISFPVSFYRAKYTIPYVP